MQNPVKDKQKERAIIIGSCVGAAVLLMLLNILVIMCIRNIRKRRATKKVQYILRPEDVNPANKMVRDKKALNGASEMNRKLDELT